MSLRGAKITQGFSVEGMERVKIMEQKRDKFGRFIKGGPGGPGRYKKHKVTNEDLDGCETVADKALKILEGGLYSQDNKEKMEAAKLLAKLDPQEKPKEVLDETAREILEFWVRHYLVREQAEEEGAPDS
jgi:hypothetical protein